MKKDVISGKWWIASREHVALVAQLVRAPASHAGGQEFDPPQE